MEVVEKQNGAPPTERPEAEEPGGGAPRPPQAHRPPQGSPAQVRPAAVAAALDLVRQEKSLEALGRMLKTKREINGLTRRDVVVKIKIPMDQLESIEDGRLSALPPVFAKGFLRAYANELGLDAEAILDDYRKMTSGFKNEPANREGLVPRYVETKMSSGGWRLGRWLLLALVLLFLGLGALGAAFWARPDFRRAVTAAWPILESWPVMTALVRPEVEEEGPPNYYTAEPVAGGSEVTVASGSLAGSAPDEEGTAPEVPQVKGGELTLVSQKDGVWLQLIVDGQPVKHFWLRRGQTIVQRAEVAVVVRTGQGTALTASWNGRDLGVLSSGQPIVEASFPPS